MNYIIYDISKQSPSLAERDIIWSVLLIGEKIKITSNFSPVIRMVGEFKYLNHRGKMNVFEFFKGQIDKEIGWDVFEAEIKMIVQLRNKKMRTQLDSINLKNKEIWLRKFENQQIEWLKGNLARFNYDEIAPLILQYIDMPEPEIKVLWHTNFVDPDADPDVHEHFVKIISDALSDKDNIFVFDERIFPFIVNHSINEYTAQGLADDKQVVVFSEQVLTMPLCYLLKENDIRMARSSMKEVFHDFHECLHKIAAGEETLQSGMEKLRPLLPDMQHKVESSNFVQTVRSQMTEVPTVEMHLAFTSANGILTLLKKLEMFNEEEMMQTHDILAKHASMDSPRPFMFIKHSK